MAPLRTGPSAGHTVCPPGTGPSAGHTTCPPGTGPSAGHTACPPAQTGSWWTEAPAPAPMLTLGCCTDFLDWTLSGAEQEERLLRPGLELDAAQEARAAGCGMAVCFGKGTHERIHCASWFRPPWKERWMWPSSDRMANLYQLCGPAQPLEFCEPVSSSVNWEWMCLPRPPRGLLK